MLRVEHLVAGYGRLNVLQGVSLAVPPGQIVAVLGANGAGKSTLCRAISGLIDCRGGGITLDGEAIGTLSTAARVRRGVVQVPEGRQVFPRMSVLENLRLGAFVHGEPGAAELGEIFALFPVLRERLAQHAGLLSGGEQQMLALARAMLSRPRALLLDEPSQGLAPLAVQQIGLVVREIARRGVGVLLVEQNLALAEMAADHALVIETGSIVAEGPAAAMIANQVVQQSYLGVQEPG